MVGLIGPNGAGKTTFIDGITGFVRRPGASSSTAASISRLPPHERARRGLARTWQSIELFDDLTVAENLMVAARVAVGAGDVARDPVASPPGEAAATRR